MKKYLFLSVLTIWSTQLFAGTVTNVRLNPDADLVVTGTTNITFEIASSEPSGDASAETAPAKVYIPMDGPSVDGVGTYEEYKYLTVPGVTALFTPASAFTINFPLYLNALSVTPVYLYAAIKLGTGDYKIAKQLSLSSYAGVTNSIETFTLSTADICFVVSSDCGAFDTSSGTEKKYLGHFFFSTTSGLAVGSSVTPTASGIFFEVNMSNRVNQTISTSPSISKIKPGDRRLIVEYSSNAAIINPKAIRIVKYTTNPAGAADNKPFFYSAAANGSLISDEYTYASSGEVTVKDLINGVDLYLGVVAVDLYKFGTLVSPTSIGTPMAIQELLKANQCFLLTAGFGENHFVIDYFRHFRDTVLMSSSIGRGFIHVYYELAPKYALIIYQHEGLRALIRWAAYVTYFVFNYFHILGFLVLLLAAVRFYRNRLKSKQSM